MLNENLPTLPEIDEVQIVAFSGDEMGNPEQYMAGATDQPKAVARDTQAQRIAGMWRTLPPGEAKRCHTPRFGVRFLASGQVLLQASICWECNTIYGDAEGEAFGFAFDGRGSVSQQLLSELQRIVAHQIGGGV